VDGRPAQDSLARGAGGAKESAAGGGVRAWPAGVAGVRGGQGRRVSQRGWTLHAVTMRLTVDEILDRLGAGVAQRVRPLAGWLESEEPAPREEPRPEDLAHLTRAERPDLGCGLLRRDLGEVPGDLEGLAPWLDRAEARRAKGAPPRWTRHTRRRLRVARAAGSLAAAARSAHASAIDPQILAGIGDAIEQVEIARQAAARAKGTRETLPVLAALARTGAGRAASRGAATRPVTTGGAGTPAYRARIG